MKSYFGFALKELRAQKLTSILILIAVILSTTMTTAVGQSVGTLQAMRISQASSLNGDRYVSFHQMTRKQMLKLSDDSRIYDVGSVINTGNTRLKNSGLTLFLREFLDGATSVYSATCDISEGRLPTSAYEIALPENALPYIDENLTVGDRITLNLSISLMKDTKPPYEYSADFTVSGILKSNYTGYATGIVNAVVGKGTSQSLLPARYHLYSTDFKTRSIDNFQTLVDQLAGEVDVSKENIQYNWVLLDALGVSYEESGSSDTDSGFAFMTASCILVGILVLLAAGLVIYNIMKISVAKRIREYGTLRAIGSDRRQLYIMVFLEIILLCVIGIPCGLLAGLYSAKGILVAATGILNPDLFMVNSTQQLNAVIAANSFAKIFPLVLSAVITLLFTAAAAYPAARYASRVSPTVAMAGQAVRIRRHVRKVKKIRHFEAYHARINLRRSLGRTCITILSLIMSITVFVALQSFRGLLDTSRKVQEIHLGDYAVTNETTGISVSSVEEMHSQELVKSLSTTKLKLYTQDKSGGLPIETSLSLNPGETLQIAGLDDDRLGDSTGDLTEQEVSELLAGTACLIKNPIPVSFEGQEAKLTELHTGDTITVAGKELRVISVVEHPVTVNNEGFTNGVQIIVCDSLYNELTGQDSYAEIYPVLHDNSDAEVFEAWLDDWCGENPGSHWLSYRQADAQMAESFEQINFLCWGLILFIGLIGILNIINTVYINIHTRVAEIGVQRAIGMSAGSLYKTFLWEGAYYGIIASFAGAVLGYICTLFVEAAASDSLHLSAIPFPSILAASAISILSCLLATLIPLRFISKMDIVDSIEAPE
ncbi:ABC transporter permease [Ruminococcus sp. OA3]|uniref:ABC transporter permease n=1 Tax=Ruminococcus sp. OA3 TaxID=2914164 RepID=UPI001F05C483|nr:ABC transporter permease [Ruminococcus sp. OA3]MCH1981884.1 ABC transporter permease [Ruminococcus sp. OA3]